MRSFQAIYESFDKEDARRARSNRPMRIGTLDKYTLSATERASNGFFRVEKCRRALEALDRCGYNRSFHQRQFHEDFIRACARIFWKTDPPGSFARDHQKILESNGWDSLSQEVLISTPRRYALFESFNLLVLCLLHCHLHSPLDKLLVVDPVVIDARWPPVYDLRVLAVLVARADAVMCVE